MNLYNINKELLILVNQVTELDGEVTPELGDALQINEADFEVKAPQYGHVIISKDYTIEMLKAEKERIDKYLQREIKSRDYLKRVLLASMQIRDITKINNLSLKISIRESSAVDVLNIAQLDEKFLNKKETITPDKVGIKKAIEQGEVVEGAVLVTNYNLQIK
jgi:hypothetical protein